MKNKTVIISGANGYFGGIATSYFESEGWVVLKATRKENADIFFDLDQPELFANLKIQTKVDLFIHAAAAHEVTCAIQPYRSISQNVIGTRAALDFCVNNNINKFVYLSTFHVFGKPLGLIDENRTPSPTNDYGLSHLQAEEYVQMYSRAKKIKGLVIRPSNFFGVPTGLENFNRWSLTPLAFCREAVQTGRIVLKTAGYQKRNFVSVTDICKVIENVYPHIGEIEKLHIPGPNTLSIRELAQLIQKIVINKLSINVELSIPDGNAFDDNFTFSSCYIRDVFTPQDNLEEFISDLCKVMNHESVKS